MDCWNCRKPIPDGAGSCPFCELRQTDDPLQEIKAIQVRLDQENLPPAERQRLLDELAEFQSLLSSLMDRVDAATAGQIRELAEQFDSAEDFAAAIFIGDCPKCGSSKTEDCEHVVGIAAELVGRCQTCGAVFCPECQTVFPNDKPTQATKRCPHCGSRNTDFDTEGDLDDEEAVPFDMANHCHDCGGAYRGFCGTALTTEDES